MELGIVMERGKQTQLWIFGLRWQAIVERNALRQARRLARQMGANGWVLSGQNLPAVGLSQKRHPGDYDLLLSAAAFFAALHPGQQLAGLFRLPNQQFWFVAAQQGRVLVRGDYCFDELGAAQSFMASVLRDHPQMRVLEAEAGYQEWTELLTQIEQIERQATIEKARLRPRVRAPARLSGFALLMLFGAASTSYWLTNSAAQVQPAETPAMPENPLEEVLASEPRSILEPVLHHLYQLPVWVQGWQLHHADCNFQLGARSWRCVAEYQRDQQASLAVDVATFLAQQQWQEQAKMLDLDRVQIHKTILPQHSQSNPTSAHGVSLFQFLGQLQQKQLAFKQINYRHRGVILPQWDNRTQIKLVGPLRSAFLVFDLPLHVHWFQLRLQVRPQAKPDMRQSVLELHLEGAVDDRQTY